MKFKFNTKSMFLEIDLSDFISKYSKVNTKIESLCGEIKTKENLESCMTRLTNLLESSTVIIKKKKFEKSIAVVKINWKVISRKDWIYLTFSTINNNKRYTYSIKLVWNLTFNKSGIFGWKRFNIEVEDLDSTIIKTSMEYWINNVVETNLGLNISFKGILVFWIIISSIFYSVTEAFSYFVW